MRITAKSAIRAVIFLRMKQARSLLTVYLKGEKGIGVLSSTLL
jgi:hypothetical protein